MTKIFMEDIFKDLVKIPTSEYSGKIRILGVRAQAVFAYPKPSDILIAAGELGNGRLIVAANKSYYYEFDEKSELKKSFNDSIKRWLSKRTTNISSSNQILDMKSFDKTLQLDRIKIIKWELNFEILNETEKRLLSFIQNGGGLYCAASHGASERKLEELSMFKFLKDNFGIILSESKRQLPKEIAVTSNKARPFGISQIILKICNEVNSINLSDLNNLDIDSLKNEDAALLRSLATVLIKNTTLPSQLNPIVDEIQRYKCSLLNNCILALNQEKAPNVEKFPGDIHVKLLTEDKVTLIIKSKFKSEWISTGFYLPPGNKAFVKILKGSIDGWNIRIGAHSDDNTYCNIYKRWPIITAIQPYLTNDLSIQSPFGGLIYFENSSTSADDIQVTLNNVVEAPYFDVLCEKTFENWTNSRKALSPWAELAGKHIIFTVPSDIVREIENPAEILDFWDEVIRCNHELRGTNVDDFRRERVVADLQPLEGYMHPGYPIVVSLDVCYNPNDFSSCIFDLGKLKKEGHWDLFHQFGRNMQRDEWTFDGSIEVTCNIFSMYTLHKIIGLEFYEQPWLVNQKKSFNKFFSRKKPTYQLWKNDSGMALMIFVHLIKYFGWQPMKKFMKEYEIDINKNNRNLPKTNQDKIDQWIVRYSSITGYDVREIFEFWGLPSKVDLKNNLKQFEYPFKERNPEVFFSSYKNI